jgi:nucleoside-diphosphate-sugar epimerase
MGGPGFTSVLTRIAHERGAAGYVGDGANRWAAVHRSDAARVARLALAKAPAGSRMHAAAEDIPTRDIAAAIGEYLGLPTVSVAPEDAEAHFGWISRFVGLNGAASHTRTQEVLGWTPTGPTLFEDIAAGAYALPG